MDEGADPDGEKIGQKKCRLKKKPGIPHHILKGRGQIKRAKQKIEGRPLAMKKSPSQTQNEKRKKKQAPILGVMEPQKYFVKKI